MSLINEALKKAAQEQDPDDPLENSYPEKIFFISRKQASGWRLQPWLLMVALVAGLAVVAFQVPTVRQFVLQLTGGGESAIPTPQPVASPAPRDIAPAGPPAPSSGPTLVTQQMEAAITAYRAGEYVKARTAFASVIELDSSSAEAHNGLALAEKALGNTKEAERHYLTAIRLDDAYAEAHNNLALLYDQRDETGRAIFEYTTALTLRPSYAEAQLNYAIALERLGRLDDAKREYLKFLSEVPPSLHDVAGTVRAHVQTLS